MPPPATSRAVAEEIARSYEKFDKQELINILAWMTKTYVVDGTMPFNLVQEKAGAVGDVAGSEKDFSFAKLIDQLKKRLTHLQELRHFTVEDDKVVLRVQNQKITFGERVTSEFVPTSTAPPAPPPKQPGGAVAAAVAAAGTVRPPPEEKAASLTEAQQEALNDIVTRFKNLELD